MIDLYRQCGATDPKPTFRVLVVAADRTGSGGHGRLIDLFAAALDLPSSLRDRLWFTTLADLRQHQHDPLPLEATIWQRERDARSWAESYRPLSENTLPDERRLSRKERRTFIEQRVVETQRHPLFPLPVEGRTTSRTSR